MATVRKRGDSYQIRVSCGYNTKGVQVSQSMTWKPETGMTEKQIQKEVGRQAVLFEEACMKGQSVTAQKFEDFSEQWFKEYAGIKLKIRTIQNYNWLKKRVYKAIGHLRMDKITPRQIQKFITDLTECERDDGKIGKISGKTIKSHVSFISTVFDYAVKMQMVQTNPCKTVTLPKIERKEPDIYTPEEAQQILDYLLQEPDKNLKHVVFYILAIFTGLRRGELLGLEWKDFNYQYNTVDVSRTSNTTPKMGVYTDTTKTKTSVRCLKLPDDVMKILKRYQEYQSIEKENIGDQWCEHDRLFTRWNGEPMFPNTPSLFFERFCKRVGIRYLNVHSFRHLTASVLLFNNVDIKTVQNYLGHSTPNTTLTIYAHAFRTAQARAMDVVADTFSLKSSELIK